MINRLNYGRPRVEISLDESAHAIYVRVPFTSKGLLDGKLISHAQSLIFLLSTMTMKAACTSETF
jgi:hypothetical protein